MQHIHKIKNARLAHIVPIAGIISALLILPLVLFQAQRPTTLPSHAAQNNQQTTYYVAPTGNNANSGAELSPWQTIQYAVDQAPAGSTIVVEDGTYFEEIVITKPGLSNRPTTLQARNQGAAVIDGRNRLPKGPWAQAPGTGPESCTSKGFLFQPLVYFQASHWVIDGFEITQSRGGGIVAGEGPETTDTNITMQNLKIHDNRHSAVRTLGYDNVQLLNSTIHDNQQFATCARNANELNWPHTINLKWGDNFAVRGNEIYRNWGEGLGFTDGKDVIVEDNYFWDNYAVNFYIHYVTNLTVRDNHLHWSTSNKMARGRRTPSGGIAINMEAKPDDIERQINSGGFWRENNNILIENNLFTGRLGYGVSFWGNNYNQAPEDHKKIGRNIRVFNNTFAFDSRARGEGVLSSSGSFYLAYENVKVHNNIFSSTGPMTGMNPNQVPSFLDMQNNLWSSQPEAAFLVGPGDVIADPQFVNPSFLYEPFIRPDPNDFKIAQSSPARDAGTTTSTTVDYFGASRTSARPMDMGFHEFGAGITPGISPSPTVSIPTPTDTPPVPSPTVVGTSPTPIPPTTGNLIRNPQFDSAHLNWRFIHYDGQADLSIINNQGIINNQSFGSQSFTQLFQSGISLEQNQTYAFSFTHQCNTPAELDVSFIMHKSPYTPIGIFPEGKVGRITNCNEETQTYQTTISVNETTRNTRLRIRLRDSAQYALDNFVLTPLSN